jgi:shikimate dehydrogenase
MTITSKTRICGLIGAPVEHSMSPVMHNKAYAALGLDYLYLAFRVAPEGLEKAVAGLRALNFRGFNVTIPHKVAIMPFLDSLDPLAQKIGAVNTVVNDGGKLRGYNTDAAGFLQTLKEHGIPPKGKKFVIMGAGGAARALAYILVENGARVVITNRKQELDWAENIARSLKADFSDDIPIFELGNLEAALKGADVLVNATSVGMSPVVNETPAPRELLTKVPAVFDVVYNPLETRFLKEAKAAGAVTVGGVEMLAWQGALAFELWTGKKAPATLMQAEAEKMLRNQA